MDGFESNDGVILIAATNRPDVLDPALASPRARPSTAAVIVDRPDIRGREEVLRVHSKKVPMAEDVNLNILARGTPGFLRRRPREHVVQRGCPHRRALQPQIGPHVPAGL